MAKAIGKSANSTDYEGYKLTGEDGKEYIVLPENIDKLKDVAMEVEPK